MRLSAFAVKKIMPIYSSLLKPTLDIIVSLLFLILFSWLLIVIILIYILTLSFPFFFVHQRTGKQGGTFRLFKFRTLKPRGNSLQERRFWLGDFLRATSLDELPQLINVLKGEMSLIGPRPLPVEYLPLMSAEQKQRHLVKPGITGWAQVNGRNAISWKEKFELDNYYVQHVSFWLDVKIVFKTIQLLLSFKKDVSLNEKPFTGNEEA